MKTAIVHDWLNGARGGEKVLEALLELYPDSTIFTLFYERGRISPQISSKRIVTSWLDRVPGVYRFYRNLAPLFPSAIESLKLNGFDLVISSSHAVAKSVDSGAARHISYCHTPMRYIWDAADDYRPGAIRRAALKCVRPRLRQWDAESSNRVHHFVANSSFVRERIRRCYGRDAEVIYPPVNTDFFTPASDRTRDEFYLAAGALVAYKRVDAVIAAFNQLGKPLVVAGAGPEMRRLRRHAGPNVKFFGWVSDQQLRELYRRARALVFAAREDFGIVPLEAQACGCPVIAYAAGGALETVVEWESGVFFDRQDPDAIVQAIRQFEHLRWNQDRLRSQALGFSRELFKSRFRAFVQQCLDGEKAKLQFSA
jgi:glycosyltransferase involved in cell wall biosynthesis